MAMITGCNLIMVVNCAGIVQKVPVVRSVLGKISNSVLNQNEHKECIQLGSKVLRAKMYGF